MTIDRRKFLLGSGLGAVGAIGALAGTGDADAAISSAPVADARSDATLGPVPFEGPHQAGILTPPPPAAAFLALDVIAEDRPTLAELLRTITARARRLTAGGVPPALGTQSPPSDSGTLGPDVPPDALTVTLGVSTTIFDDRFGLASQRPIRLTTMKAFPNDGLEPDYLGGDMMLQLCAGSTDTVLHALRDIARHTRGAMQIRYRMDGFISPPRPDGVPRNHLGFMDGIANPDVRNPKIADQLLWVVKGQGEPEWAVGGSYHVIRLIRMFTEFWERVSMHQQQTIIGRYRDNRILRRGFNYDLGIDVNGTLDMGLIFNCFQQDVIRQFEATQTRLTDEPLADYIKPFGGGYFFALPGVRNSEDWLGRGLLEA